MSTVTTTDMMSAFQRVFGAKFTDMAWRSETSVWGKAWHECSHVFHARIESLEADVNSKSARIAELERRLERCTGGIGK